MNEEQLIQYRLLTRIQVRDGLLHRLLRALAKSGVAVAPLLQEIGQTMREDTARMTFREVDPATSMLGAAETEEALEELLRRLQQEWPGQ